MAGLARASREKEVLTLVAARADGMRRVHFTNREEEVGGVPDDNPRTMKTTEIHEECRAPARRSPGRVRQGLLRLRARSGGDDRQRGAVAVEFALIAPVLVLLTFGVIEFSSAYHDSSIAADAARAGARVGSAKAMQTDFASAAASAASSAVSTLPTDVPQELWVYKANSQGYPGGGSSFSSCSSNCIRYTYSAGSKQFVPSGGGGWTAASHQVCTQPYDEIGVYVKLKHPFVTKLFGAPLTLTDHAVFRFEPVATSACS